MRTAYIETLYRGINYGSRLQAFGLARYLANCGYKPVMVDNFKVPSVFAKHPSIFAARVHNRLHLKERHKFFLPSPYDISDTRMKRLAAYEEANIEEALFVDSRSWEEALANNPIFVAGSDIMWHPARGYPARHFLDYAVTAGAPCFSYASSIGAKELPKKYYHAYRKYLGAFASISVREEASIKLLEPIVGKPIIKVVDPTLLHEPNVWDELAAKAELSQPISDKGFAVCYFVMDDPRYWEYVAKIQAETNLQVVVLPMHHADEEQPYTVILDGTPYEFVWLIKHANMVVTDSFHACCFSLLYQKDFYLIRRTRASEDDKYNDFLGRYELANRVVANTSFFEPKEETDYSFALEKLQNDRIDSMAFIEGTLAQIEAIGGRNR